MNTPPYLVFNIRVLLKKMQMINNRHFAETQRHMKLVKTNMERVIDNTMARAAKK